jgi:hypothetical protein
MRPTEEGSPWSAGFLYQPAATLPRAVDEHGT